MAAPADACLNCGHALVPVRLNFCPECGQDTNLHPPTLREFAQQFGGSYIAVEGALWRSLKLLLFRPGVLTREYLDGRRRRYVLPLRLYLTISVIVLLLVRMVAVVDTGNLDVAVEQAKPPRTVTVQLGIGEAGLRDGVFFCHRLPAWLCSRLQARVTLEPGKMVEEIKRSGERVLTNVGSAMFVLLPGSAFLLWLVYRNRRLRYTEHLVFALHLHAFVFVMLGLLLVDWSWLSAAALMAVPVYSLIAMRRVYGGRWWPQFLRGTVIAAVYAAAFGLTLVVMWLWAFIV